MSAKGKCFSVQKFNRGQDVATKVKVNPCVNEFKGFGRESAFMFNGSC
jgi:hypothetical protein